MDKVQKYNSFNTNTPSSESYRKDRLSVKSKLTIYKALIGYKITHACPAWEYEAESQLFKLQVLQVSLITY